MYSRLDYFLPCSYPLVPWWACLAPGPLNDSNIVWSDPARATTDRTWNSINLYQADFYVGHFVQPVDNVINIHKAFSREKVPTPPLTAPPCPEGLAFSNHTSRLLSRICCFFSSQDLRHKLSWGFPSLCLTFAAFLGWSPPPSSMLLICC